LNWAWSESCSNIVQWNYWLLASSH